MQQAIHAFTTAHARGANDNDPTKPRRDRWRLLIDGFKAMGLVAFAVHAAECKLAGYTVDDYCEMVLALCEQRSVR